MFKKCISIAISIVLLCCFLPSCGKEPEEGTIEDVVIDQPVPDEDSDNIFTKADSPYDYEYTTFSFKKAHMRIDVPRRWNVTYVNHRYIMIQTPSDDGFVPNTTISILCNYGENVEENDLSEYTLNNHAFAFSQYFKKELAGLPTYTGGIKRHLRKYEAEDDIYNGLEFVDKDHAEYAATLTVDSVVLVDKSNNYYSDECGMVTTYVKWDHSPFCFNAIVDKSYMDNARAIIEYIASSISYDESRAEGYKSVEYKRNFSTSVPNSCVPVNGAENVYISSFYDNKETAGMAVGVFTLEGVNANDKIDDGLDSSKAGTAMKKEDVEAEDINKDYGPQIADLSFATYGTDADYNVFVEECKEDGGPDFSGTLLADCSYDDATAIAGSVFGGCGYYLMDCYVVEKDNQCFLISVIYQECQKNIARAAGKTAVRKLRTK